MISRILYDKGYHEYVEAAKLIKKLHTSTEFYLLGDIDESYPAHVPREIVEKDHGLGHIVYLGYCTDVREVISQIDCLVHPTFYNEGLSRVLMEALAMSKPIITTDIPGCRETVDVGVNGFLCKPKSVNSLVSAIQNYLDLSSEERIKMGKNGRLKAESQFDIKKVISVYESITNKYL